MTIGEIYKLTDAHPPSFGEVTSVTQNEIWDHDLEVDEEVELAWADWYQRAKDLAQRACKARKEK